MYRISYRTDDIGWRVWANSLPTLAAARKARDKVLNMADGVRPVTVAVIIRERDLQQIELKDWSGRTVRYAK